MKALILIFLVLIFLIIYLGFGIVIIILNDRTKKSDEPFLTVRDKVGIMFLWLFWMFSYVKRNIR
jgi:hypothetical protein